MGEKIYIGLVESLSSCCPQSRLITILAVTYLYLFVSDISTGPGDGTEGSQVRYYSWIAVIGFFHSHFRFEYRPRGEPPFPASSRESLTLLLPQT